MYCFFFIGVLFCINLWVWKLKEKFVDLGDCCYFCFLLIVVLLLYVVWLEFVKKCMCLV